MGRRGEDFLTCDRSLLSLLAWDIDRFRGTIVSRVPVSRGEVVSAGYGKRKMELP
jgi:hypothetical protein